MLLFPGPEREIAPVDTRPFALASETETAQLTERRTVRFLCTVMKYLKVAAMATL
jgi:hypothetical protein